MALCLPFAYSFFSMISELNALHHYSQYNISRWSSGKCGFTISINRPSVQGGFFDETVEYKWWVWVLDWWVLIIMHISPSLKRACEPPGQTAGMCCPQQVFIPSWQFNHLSSEYLATHSVFAANVERSSFFSCDLIWESSSFLFFSTGSPKSWDYTNQFCVKIRQVHFARLVARNMESFLSGLDQFLAA